VVANHIHICSSAIFTTGNTLVYNDKTIKRQNCTSSFLTKLQPPPLGKNKRQPPGTHSLSGGEFYHMVDSGMGMDRPFDIPNFRDDPIRRNEHCLNDVTQTLGIKAITSSDSCCKLQIEDTLASRESSFMGVTRSNQILSLDSLSSYSDVRGGEVKLTSRGVKREIYGEAFTMNNYVDCSDMQTGASVTDDVIVSTDPASPVWKLRRDDSRGPLILDGRHISTDQLSHASRRFVDNVG